VQYAGVTFSNDGHYIYYVIRNQERGQLRKITLTGGDSAFVADDIDGPVATNPGGDELAFRRDTKKLAYVVLTAGRFGAEEQLTSGDTDLVDRRVAWARRTNRIAIFKYPRPGASGMTLELLDPKSRKPDRAITIPAWRGVSQAAWLSNGHDLIVSAETQEETQETMQLRTVSSLNGSVRNVTSDSYGYHGASISADGTRLVTVRWDRQTRFWISPSTNLDNGGPIKAADSGLYSSLAWTGDGRLITAANRGEGTNVWLVDPQSGALKKLIAGNSAPRDPVWLPREQAVAYAAEKNGIWQSNSRDGSTRLLTRAPGYVESLACAPDGTSIYYAVWETQEVSVWVLPLGGAVNGPRRLLHNARHPVLSPDGKYIAVEQSDDLAERGWRTSVYRLPDMQLVATPHIPVGSRTRWHPDGTALTYIVTDSDGTSNIWAQPLNIGPPRRLTSFREDQIFDYNWSFDGQRLACLRGTTVSDAFLLTHQKSLLGKLNAWLSLNSLR
jgi:dipeptidyl aminopeptidase/acylaminoacyl peptidase